MSAWSIKQKKIKKQHEKEEAKTKLEALFKRDISPPVDEKQNDIDNYKFSESYVII